MHKIFIFLHCGGIILIKKEGKVGVADWRKCFFMIALTIETWIFTLIFKIQLTVGGLAGLRLQRNSLQTLYIENGQT